MTFKKRRIFVGKIKYSHDNSHRNNQLDFVRWLLTVAKVLDTHRVVNSRVSNVIGYF